MDHGQPKPEGRLREEKAEFPEYFVECEKAGTVYTFLFLLLQVRISWSLNEHCINSNQENKAMIFDINILAKEE